MMRFHNMSFSILPQQRQRRISCSVLGILFMFLICLPAFFLTSCGYSTRSTLPPNLRTVYVEHFKNSITFTAETKRDIYLPLLEVDVRNAIIDRFLFDGNLKIAEQDRADLILKGELKSYERTALRFLENEDVEEYRVSVTVSLSLWDTQKQEYVWQEPSFTGEADYFVSGPEASSEQAAVSAAMIDLARRAVERTIENW